MNLRNSIDKLSELGKRVGRRNWIIIGAVVLIGTAVCLNFMLNGV